MKVTTESIKQTLIRTREMLSQYSRAARKRYTPSAISVLRSSLVNRNRQRIPFRPFTRASVAAAISSSQRSGALGGSVIQTGRKRQSRRAAARAAAVQSTVRRLLVGDQEVPQINKSTAVLKAPKVSMRNVSCRFSRPTVSRRNALQGYQPSSRVYRRRQLSRNVSQQVPAAIKTRRVEKDHVDSSMKKVARTAQKNKKKSTSLNGKGWKIVQRCYVKAQIAEKKLMSLLKQLLTQQGDSKINFAEIEKLVTKLQEIMRLRNQIVVNLHLLTKIPSGQREIVKKRMHLLLQSCAQIINYLKKQK